jgi:hypothetical protein
VIASISEQDFNKSVRICLTIAEVKMKFSALDDVLKIVEAKEWH